MNTEAKLTEAMSGLVDIQSHLAGMSKKSDSIAQRLLKSADFEAFKSGRADLLTLDITPRELKTAITSTQTINDPLAGSFTPTIDAGTRRKLVIRDLLPTFPTINGAIEMPVKSGATNNAASQNGDNTALAESAYTFETSFIAVETLGHFIPVSSQIFEDAGSLDALINTELLHGLGLVEQDQLLNGVGTGHELHGLVTNATAYSLQSPQLTSEADIIRDAMKQIELADFEPSAIILNPSDWYDLDTAKASTSDAAYTSGAPRLMTTKTLWGLPVVTSNNIAAGSFLVGDFNRAAILFDREKPQVQIARHDGTNFQTGMLTIKATERVALVVTNPLALVTGSL